MLKPGTATCYDELLAQHRLPSAPGAHDQQTPGETLGKTSDDAAASRFAAMSDIPVDIAPVYPDEV